MARWGATAKFAPIKSSFPDELKGIEQALLRDLTEVTYKSVKAVFESGEKAFPPLSETTRWLRRQAGQGMTPRIASGDLLRALDYTIGDGEATIGILIPRGSKGQDLEMIARIMEDGAMIRVTENMRRWFAAKGRPLKRTTLYIRVPPRPVFSSIGPEFDKQIDELVTSSMDDILKAL